MSGRLEVCGLLAAITVAFAQSPSWEELNRDATHLQQEGKYTQAKAVFLQALKQVESGNIEDPRIAITLNNLASVYQDLDDAPSAKRYYAQTIAVFERIHGRDHPVLAKPLHNLATLLLDQGQFAAAERMWRRALALHSEAEGLSAADTTMMKYGIAAAVLAEGRTREAEAIYLEIVNGGVSDSEAAEIHNGLGVLYAQTKHLQDSIPEFLTAISILERTSKTGHPACLKPLSNLAVVWSRLGRYDEAESVLRRALALAKSALGEGATYGRLLETYATVLRKLGKTSEAKDLEKRASAILSAGSRDPSPRYTVDMGDLLRTARK